MFEAMPSDKDSTSSDHKESKGSTPESSGSTHMHLSRILGDKSSRDPGDSKQVSGESKQQMSTPESVDEVKAPE